jgi:hypothetical protein
MSSCWRRAHSSEVNREAIGRLVLELTNAMRGLPNGKAIDEDVWVLDEDGMVVGLA